MMPQKVHTLPIAVDRSCLHSDQFAMLGQTDAVNLQSARSNSGRTVGSALRPQESYRGVAPEAFGAWSTSTLPSPSKSRSA